MSRASPLSQPELETLQQELDTHGILVIPGQAGLPPSRQAEIYKALSPHDPSERTYIDSNSHFPETPQVHVLGNVDVDQYLLHQTFLLILSPCRSADLHVFCGAGMVFKCRSRART